MTENQDLTARLTDLQALSNKKKIRLAKPEQDEVLTVLTALCKQGSDGFRLALNTLPDFPSDIGAQALTACWTDLQSRQEPVARSLQEAKFRSDLGRRLRFALAQRLITLDPDNALRILLDVCQDCRPAKGAIPSSKDLALIKTALLDEGSGTLTRLPLERGMDSQVSFLVTSILAAAFVPQKGSHKPLSEQNQLAVIRWAGAYPKLQELPQPVSSALVQTVSAWNQDFRSLLATGVDTLHPALRTVLQPICNAPPSLPPVPEPQSPRPRVLETPATKPASFETPHQPTTPNQHPPYQRPPQQDAYDPLFEIGRLATHIKELQARLRKSANELSKAEADWRHADTELKTARREREDTRRMLAVTNEEAAKSAAQEAATARDIASLREELAAVQTQLATANDNLREATENHRKQLAALSERISKEGESRVATYRNRLAASLRPFSVNLREANDMEMTLDLGKALHTQMKQLFRLLKTEGIQIEQEGS